MQPLNAGRWASKEEMVMFSWSPRRLQGLPLRGSRTEESARLDRIRIRILEVQMLRKDEQKTRVEHYLENREQRA